MNSARPCYEFFKRAADIALAIVLLVLLAPLGIMLAALIWARTGRPVIFVQQRIGLNGKPFRMLKFRTLNREYPSEEVKPRDDDPGITPIGRWMRLMGLDELPQLVNILCGEMSFVGPRPEMPSIVAGYTPHERKRLSVKPGITGMWQLYADTRKAIHESIEYDLCYISRRSLLWDVWLLLRTLAVPIAGLALSLGKRPSRHALAVDSRESSKAYRTPIQPETGATWRRPLCALLARHGHRSDEQCLEPRERLCKTMLHLCAIGMGLTSGTYGAGEGVEDDWEGIVRFSTEHGVDGLVYEGVKRAGLISAVDPVVTATMRQGALGNVIVQLRQSVAVKRLMQVLDAADVPCVVLKGIALAYSCYSEPGMRYGGDVDLLVGPEDLRRAMDALLDAGCQLNIPSERSPSQMRFLDNQIPLSLDGINIELHWDLVNWRVGWEESPTSNVVSRMLARRVPITMGDLKMWALRREDALLHSCLHLFLHAPPRRLRWLCDIALLCWAGAEGVRWSLIWDEIRDSRRARLLGNAVRCCVVQAAYGFGLSTPPEAAGLPSSAVLDHLFGWQPDLHPVCNFSRIGHRGMELGRMKGTSLAHIVVLPWLASRRSRGAGRALLRRIMPPRTVLQELYGSYCPGVTHLKHFRNAMQDFFLLLCRRG